MILLSTNLFSGQNGAMYFSEMQANGGLGIGDNNAGAAFGTGYCDAQCPHDIKFIDGEANVIDWKPNENDFSNNMGAGKYGACCAEMDIWEANSMATAYTPHTCGTPSKMTLFQIVYHTQSIVSMAHELFFLLLQVYIGVRALIVVTMIRASAMMEFATKMVVISTLIVS